MKSKADASPHAFPWAQVMAFGFGVLRLSPQHFWSMSLPELAAAMRGAGGNDAGALQLDRDALAMLMHKFPD